MGVPPDERGIQHLCGEDIVGVLRQQRQPPGDLLPAHRVHQFAVQAYGAGVGLPQAGERQQRQRLAAAVAAEDGNDLAAAEGHVQCFDQHPSGHADAQRRYLQQWFVVSRHPDSLAQRSLQRKRGRT